MKRTNNLPGVLSRSFALLTVLAITTGWSAPASAPIASGGASAAAAAAYRDVAATALKLTTREAGWDARAASNAATTARNAAPIDTTKSPRRPWAEAPAPAPAKVAKEKPKAHAEAPAKVTKVTKDQPKDKPKAHAPTFRGSNHFWIPSLGMSYGVRPYGCSQSFYPGNHMYRWGCAGKNNVYILGHAHSVMRPLHDLYVSGGLHRGMVAVFADAKGHVTKYRVTEWRVVRPTEIAWQIAAQPVPSMTLQTCVGKDSQFRLNVRLVRVK